MFQQNSSVWGVQRGGYDPGFHEILVHSPSPAFIKLNSFGWNICSYKVLGGFHMKSAGFYVKSTGFYVKSKDHLQGIVTLCSNICQNSSQFQIFRHDFCLQIVDTFIYLWVYYTFIFQVATTCQDLWRIWHTFTWNFQLHSFFFKQKWLI